MVGKLDRATCAIGSWSAVLCALGLVVCPRPVDARPFGRGELFVPQVDLQERTRAPAILPPFLAAMDGLGSFGQHQILNIHDDLRIDPSAGTVAGVASITLVAGANGLRNLLALVDDGLVFDRIYTDEGDVPWRDAVQGGYAYGQVVLDDPIPSGETVTFHFSYAGSLLCGSGLCEVDGVGLDFALSGTAIALFYDASSPSVPYYERTARLELPTGVATYALAEQGASEVSSSGTVTEWRIPVAQGYASYGVVFGDLVEHEVGETVPPTRLISERGESVWMSEIAGWIPKILAFLERQTGTPLPMTSVDFVVLPESSPLPGTAGHGGVLLATYYGGPGARYFEETWAHEASHLWWGAVTTDAHATSRFLSEGLALMTQLDYSATEIFDPEDRDAYLVRRYNGLRIVSAYESPFWSLPPVIPPPASARLDPEAWRDWAYLKGAAIHDLLRLSIGRQAFERGLQGYAEACAYRPCPLDAYERAMSGAAGLDLGWFFEQFVFGNEDAKLHISFAQETDSLLDLTVKQETDLRHRLPLTIELQDGTATSTTIAIDALTTTVALPVTGAVRRVRPPSRYRLLVGVDSGNAFDLDFDQDVDGTDVVMCAHAVGGRARATEFGDGLGRTNIDFNVDCDFDRDGWVSDADLERLMAQVGAR